MLTYIFLIATILNNDIYHCEFMGNVYVYVHVYNTRSLSIDRFNYDPTVQVPPKDIPRADVGGIDRYKFFRR